MAIDTKALEHPVRMETDHAVIVTSDGHCGPQPEQLREYCPKDHLEEFDAFWKRFKNLIGERGTYQVKVITDETDFFGDVGVSRGHTEELIHTAGGKDYQIQARWTAVTRKENGQWKIFRVQGSVNPIANPAINELVGKTRLMFGASGAAAGLVLTLFGCLLWRKRNEQKSIA